MLTVGSNEVVKTLAQAVKSTAECKIDPGRAEVLKVILEQYETIYFCKQKSISDYHINAICTRYIGRILRSLIIKRGQDICKVYNVANIFTMVFRRILNDKATLPVRADPSSSPKTYEICYILEVARTSLRDDSDYYTLEGVITEFNRDTRREDKKTRTQAPVLRSYCKLYKALLKSNVQKKQSAGAMYSIEALKIFIDYFYRRY